MQLSASDIAAATGGTVVAGPPYTLATSFSIDSRTLEPGACFVALRDSRDGHEFVADAFARGASVAIVEHPVPAPSGRAVVRVGSAPAALAALASSVRRRMSGLVVVGISGSVGKTTTKDLVAGAVGTTRRVHASPGSYNNEAGVPLTVLSTPPDAEVLVAEMGARFPGNIAALCDVAQPHIGVITQIGLAHAEHLGGPEGVARTKAELFAALPDEGVAVLNADDDYAAMLEARAPGRVVRAGTGADVDVRVTVLGVDDELRPELRFETADGAVCVRLALRGEHQAVNAALAVATARELGVPLASAAAGLERARTADRRMDLLRTAAGVTVIDDTHNASPSATAAALRALARLRVEGRRVAVLGDMLELGPGSDDAHAAVGPLVAAAGVDVLVAVGQRAAIVADAAREAGVPDVAVAADAGEAAALAVAAAHPGDGVLVKASRAVGLERVVEALTGAAR